MTATILETPRRESTAWPRNAAPGDRASIFERLQDPDVNLCVWRRRPVRAVSRELAAFTSERLIDVRCRTTASSFPDDIRSLLSDAALDPGAYEGWIGDMQALGRVFFPLTGGRAVTVRLETCDDDGCRRYHVDRSYLRLLCTHRGPGMEWLADEQVDRASLCGRTSNDQIVRSGEPFRLAPFWVGIFKGSRHTGGETGGLVHRSPPIGGTGQLRVRFCLDC